VNEIKIALTERQVDAANWLLGCPLFGEDSQSLAHGWDINDERAADLVAAAKLARVDGLTLILPKCPEIVEYLHEYAEQLADMDSHEYLDELIAKGVPHRKAQCKANAAAKSTSALAEKIAEHLP
jgi:hypothetical protein